MSQHKILISGTGCALADFLYNNISFNSTPFKKYKSKKAGDGGLSPGKLVFTEELEAFSGCSYDRILKEITGNKPPDGFNIGGPSLVSLIHASQLLPDDKFSVKFFGTAGKDKIARDIFATAGKTPLNIENFHATAGKASPFTDVLSDPQYDNGHGERTFVNNIGVAWEYQPEFLTEEFYDSEIVCFGGTALVPRIHENLTSLLEKARKHSCITLVNTVFDFLSEIKNPGNPWPLGSSVKSLGLIDILIMDREEALKISGQISIERTIQYLTKSGVSAFIITNGPNDLYAWSDGTFFTKTSVMQLPVSEKVTRVLKMKPELKGDTTGCGDNFAGGIIVSLANQLRNNSSRGQFDLNEAVSWGVSSGGFSCFTLGGTYLEKNPGEKYKQILELQQDYLKQIGH